MSGVGKGFREEMIRELNFNFKKWHEACERSNSHFRHKNYSEFLLGPEGVPGGAPLSTSSPFFTVNRVARCLATSY